ncbi:glycosyltransferase family 4 protein [Butyrivibrio sp. MB2005]|uniref:glycosyltransferase family 4 protein n=1 Tax=Butyrivibrio sp. MB2005 TaxID=1280678 RepID=UPI0003FEB3B2|nr:glycosyltransferase family 4 protein [Butyrivibrio sp. MB2005]
MNRRVFIFSYRNYQGNVGGSAGVCYRLLKANYEYKSFDNLIGIFKNKTISHESDLDISDVRAENSNSLRKWLSQIGLLNLVFHRVKLGRAQKWMSLANTTYGFNSEDAFIFHDVESAYAFNKLYKLPNKYLVYHQQGTLYNEWAGMKKSHSFIYKTYLDSFQRKLFECMDRICFPSLGAKKAVEGMNFSDRYMDEAAILYNGFDKNNLQETESAEVKELLGAIDGRTVFTSISNINYEKGVDRIPDFLGDLSKRGKDFLWIIVGDGAYSGELSKKIDSNNLSDKVFWIKDKLRHDDVCKILSISHFYIMFHRTSIFDFATLEAMAYGAVPILTRVGGNEEMIVDGESGLFIDEISSSSKVTDLLDGNGYDQIKTNCMLRQSNLYSEERFLGRYVELINGRL